MGSRGLPPINLACVASVSVWLRSKQRPRDDEECYFRFWPCKNWNKSQKMIERGGLDRPIFRAVFDSRSFLCFETARKSLRNGRMRITNRLHSRLLRYTAENVPRLPNFNMLFQLVLTNVFIDELLKLITWSTNAKGLLTTTENTITYHNCKKIDATGIVIALFKLKPRNSTNVSVAVSELWHSVSSFHNQFTLAVRAIWSSSV